MRDERERERDREIDERDTTTSFCVPVVRLVTKNNILAGSAQE